MKYFLIYITIFILSTFKSSAQENDRSLYMSHSQNNLWLNKVKNSNKKTQWNYIYKRFLDSSNLEIDLDSDKIATPVILIAGRVFETELGYASRKKISQLITYEKLESILIMDKVPENLHINKPFTGIILISLNDKRVSRKFEKILQRLE
ncbi:hypothetical protein [Labilibacter marinus]|uniref:hypothetical protein n=1 Tax=Labilibacter marinus TaxID=1477105 RepID=UPI001179E6F7|nr:hypothetical protein [Labilibacter marinus]